MKVCLVVGARPNFVKAAAILPALEAVGIQVVLVHTGQHSSDSMSAAMFRDLGLRDPDIVLNHENFPQSVLAGMRLGDWTSGLTLVLEDKKPDLVIVVGDCDSALAGALASVKLGIKVAHVEAGLRCYDRRMQEELNRLAVDALSDVLFASEQSAWDNLVDENMSQRVQLVGNCMLDTLKRMLPEAMKLGETSEPYALLTLHRKENVDDPKKLLSAMNATWPVARRMPVIFPVHPRTLSAIRESGTMATARCWQEILIRDPMSYLRFIWHVAHATVVLTDSGGVQEETTSLGIPCLTLRDSTERPSTVDEGTNRIVGTDAHAVELAMEEILAGCWSKKTGPKLWDGHAAERIAEVIAAQQTVNA